MRLLVVEDNARLAGVLRQGLGEQGFTVDVARDGLASLTIALESDYDAILLDAMLPGKSGFDVLRELRERSRKTPILMLTARASVEDRVQGLDLGADDDLPKPFDFSELLARSEPSPEGRRIDLPFEVKLIHTIRGTSYPLRAPE